MNKTLKIVIVILCVCILVLVGYIVYDKVLKKVDEPTQDKPSVDVPVVTKSNEFNYNLILNNHDLADKNKNYLISPYSIEIALNMLRDGADGETKTEIDKVIGTRTINDVTIKDKVNVANAMIMNESYKKHILSTYQDNLKNKYDAELLTYRYAELVDAINNWVKEKTKGMIPKIIDNINANYVLSLINALAIDVEWRNEFECKRTTNEEFTKADNSKIIVEMMHDDGKYQYIKESHVEGIVLPYKKIDGSNVELEFVGLIPTGNLDSYINNNLETDLKNLNNLVKTPTGVSVVNLSLPRFTYDSKIEKFIELLQTLGIKKAFYQNEADFKNMVGDNLQVYVSQAVHKTHIELMEKGTKAAAVTYIEMAEKSALPVLSDNIDIKFDKPFIYLIREKNTEEMLFFGVVYEPNLWKGSTCSNSK